MSKFHETRTGQAINCDLCKEKDRCLLANLGFAFCPKFSAFVKREDPKVSKAAKEELSAWRRA